VRFVFRAREHARKQEMAGKPFQKFDSMWKILSTLNSTGDHRRPLAVWKTINYLANNPGKYRKVDIQEATQIPASILTNVLISLADCGVIDYESPLKEVEGK